MPDFLGLGTLGSSLMAAWPEFLYALFLWLLNMIDAYIYDLGGIIPEFND